MIGYRIGEIANQKTLRPIYPQRQQDVDHQCTGRPILAVYAKTDIEEGRRGITAFLIKRDMNGFSRVKNRTRWECVARIPLNRFFLEVTFDYVRGEEGAVSG